VPAGLSQQLLDFVGALVGALAHRHPPEHLPEQPAFLQPVCQRTCRVQKLQFCDGTCRYHAGGELVILRLPELVLQDAEQS